MFPTPPGWAAIGLAFGVLSAGCALWSGGAIGAGWRTPTLRAARVTEITRESYTYRSALWASARPLVVKARRGSSELPIRLQAIHDGLKVAILLLWFDRTESLERRTWVWNEARRQYALETNPVDQAALVWPLRGDPRLCMLGGGDAVWDVWLWRAGWSDLAGYADDGRLVMTVHPAETPPHSVAGALYPSLDGRRRVEVVWIPDAGRPGVIELPAPRERSRLRMPGAEAAAPAGSAADVETRGLYQPYYPDDSRGIWFDAESRRLITPHEDAARGYWFVAFYRNLTTGDGEADAPLKVGEAATFAAAVWDAAGGAEHWTTGPIRLVLER